MYTDTVIRIMSTRCKTISTCNTKKSVYRHRHSHHVNTLTIHQHHQNRQNTHDNANLYGYDSHNLVTVTRETCWHRDPHYGHSEANHAQYSQNYELPNSKDEGKTAHG